MGKFETAYKFTKTWEGGLDDDPVDAGGITKYGVSIEFLKDCERLDSTKLLCLGIKLPVSRESIKSLRIDQARDLFRWRFWDTPHFDRYDAPLAVTLFDCAVNHGTSRAIRLAQKAFNAISTDLGGKLAVDGIQGPLTKAALNSLPATSLAKEIIKQRKAFYQAIVDSRPSQKKFLKGWLNRANDLERYVEAL